MTHGEFLPSVTLRPMSSNLAASTSMDHFSVRSGVPRGVRTPVAAVRGRCPRPLDDGDAVLQLYNDFNRWQIDYFVFRALPLLFFATSMTYQSSNNSHFFSSGYQILLTRGECSIY